MMLRVFMGIAGLSTVQDDILEALGIAHQVHVCGFCDSETERPAPTRRRAEGPRLAIWRVTRPFARPVLPVRLAVTAGEAHDTLLADKLLSRLKNEIHSGRDLYSNAAA
jgi:hypothetical protein